MSGARTSSRRPTARGGGVVRVTEALTLQDGGLLPWVEHARRVEGMEGSVPLEWRLEPRFDWGREPPRIVPRAGTSRRRGRRAAARPSTRGARGRCSRRRTRSPARSRSRRGRRRCSRSSPRTSSRCHAPIRDHVEARLDATRRVWERWLGMWAYDGPWEEEVARSALALKLLVYAPSGSIAAAPTTSLPEVIGGDKNYDYRYAWVRDSAFTLDALMRLGLPEQVQQSFAWLLRAVRETAPDLRPFYDLDGGVPHAQRDARPPPRLPRLAARPLRQRRRVRSSSSARGATCSRPPTSTSPRGTRSTRTRARCSRAASTASAIALAGRGLRDVGARRAPPLHELEDLGLDGARPGAASRRAGPAARRPRAAVARAARPAPRLDRGELLVGGARRLLRLGRRGVARRRGPAGRAGWATPSGSGSSRTVDTIRERLAAAPGLIYRTSEHVGQEGAFVACSFWVVEALARLGRVDEACETMEQLSRTRTTSGSSPSRSTRRAASSSATSRRG